MIGALISMLAMTQEAVLVSPPPPPSNGVAVLDCHVTTLDGQHLTARVRLDYGKNRFTPWVSVESSDHALVAPVAAMVSIARGDSLLRYASTELPGGMWQIVEFQVDSSLGNRATVQFYRQNMPASRFGPNFNTLNATGICTEKLEGQS